MGSDQQELWGRWASATDRPDRPDPDNRIDKVVTDYSNTPRDQTRVPLAHRIQLKFDRFSGFINEYFSNISPGGIFIRTDTPEAPGQLLEFEFRLGDGYELIHGRGEVVWARERGEGPERPPGMGVRFLDLSPGSKDLIYKIVDDYVAHGGKPFDPSPPPALAGPEAGAAEPHGEAPAPRQEARAAAPDLPAGPPEAPAPGAEAQLAGASGLPPGPGVPRSPAVSAPGSARAAAAPPADPSPLPWRLEIPAIQPLPGVPAITPRSPLESLGAGGAGGAAADAGEAMHGALSETAHGAQSEAAGDGLSTGHHFDPLAQVAAALPPLDELAPDVPALPPLDELVAGVSAPPPAPAAAPGATAPAAAAPAFSAFDLRTPRRRSRLPLIAALLAVALAGLAVYLLRDTALAWIEGREAAQAPARPVAPASPAAPAPAAGGAGPRGPRSPADRQAAAASSSTGAVQSPAGGPNAGVGQPPASGGATSGPDLRQPPAGAAGARGAGGAPPGAGATAAGKVAGTPAAAGAATSPARGGGTAPVHTGAAASQAAAAPPAAASSSTPPGAGVSPAGRAVLEPLAPAGNGRGAGAPAGARLTSVLRITFQPVADGTEVVLWGNGEFPSQSYTHVRVSGLPVREVIRINGIDRPFPSPRLAVRTPELLQIRTGYHPPQELHVVLDLGSRDVQVTGFEPGPRQLRIHLRAR